MSEGKASSSASTVVSDKTVDTIVRAATGVAAAVILGRFVYQQMFSKPQPDPATVSAETQAKLDNTLERIKRAKVIAILRLQNLEKALERVVELADMGYTVHALIGDRCMIGVGTITTLKQLEIAHTGGAAFALSPVNPKFGGFEENGFVKECHARGILAMPAAYTPQEVYEAVARGARTVKLFPAQKWTPAQLKALKGVGDFKDANICPSGGIDHGNASEWLAAGATAVGMGSCLAGRDIKIQDSSSEQFQAAVDNWNSVEKPAAADLAARLGLRL